MARPSRLSLLLPLTLLACAGTVDTVAPEPPPPEPHYRVYPELVERWGELIDTLGASLDPALSCGAVAKTLDLFVATHPELGEASEAHRLWEEDALRAKVSRFRNAHRPGLDQRIDAGIRCQDDPVAMAAFDRFYEAARLKTR